MIWFLHCNSQILSFIETVHSDAFLWKKSIKVLYSVLGLESIESKNIRRSLQLYNAYVRRPLIAVRIQFNLKSKVEHFQDKSPPFFLRHSAIFLEILSSKLVGLRPFFLCFCGLRFIIMRLKGAFMARTFAVLSWTGSRNLLPFLNFRVLMMMYSILC